MQRFTLILFSVYVVLADRVARRPQPSGIDGLAAAMVIAAVVVTPIGGWQAAPAFLDPIVQLAGIGVGISSSVIPYVTDQLAVARLPRTTYATMVALLPAIATVIGIVVLAQIPTWSRCRPSTRQLHRPIGRGPESAQLALRGQEARGRGRRSTGSRASRDPQ